MKFAATYAIADRDFLNNAKPKVRNVTNYKCSNTFPEHCTYFILKIFINLFNFQADEIVNNVKDAFGESVKDATWMDPDTKELVLEKSENLIGLIGFPDWLLNRTMLEDYYSTVSHYSFDVR